MPDPALDELVAAWVAWDAKALITGRLRRPPDHWLHAESARLVDAIKALGLDGNALHNRVAALRRGGVDAETAVRQAAAEKGVTG